MEVPSFLPCIWADEDRLQEVIFNLLDNAFKFTHYEGYITLAGKSTGKSLIVTVKDNGHGMNKDRIQTVFKGYYDSVLKENQTGFGIGLPLCKEIVKLHKGRIWVNSKIDEGSIFSFSIPVTDC